jgi:glycosyltransferase involved in cell wall biosynthesis
MVQRSQAQRSQAQRSLAESQTSGGPLPISCFIVARDEADRIAPVLDAVRGLVDEILVIDSGSTDGTQDLAREHGARVIANPWPGYGPQKRFGEEQCRNDWLLNLDADEVVTGRLAADIRALFAAGAPPLAGYRMRIVTVYPGKSEPRWLADCKNNVRLYDRRQMRFSDSPVHDSVEPGGHRLGQLAGPVHHFSIRSPDHLRVKASDYARYQAEVLPVRSVAGLYLRLPFEFAFSFLKFYLLRRHFTGGLMGARIAAILAGNRTARLTAMLKARRSPGRTPG